MSTALDAYMKKQDVGDAAFAALIKRDRSMVSKLRRGVVRPTIDLAAAIETATDGAVPMQAWATADQQSVAA
jgi:DNA-binding transcriptional regulator YdaS (Cro superfamily)